jgi:hypothetical protein
MSQQFDHDLPLGSHNDQPLAAQQARLEADWDEGVDFPEVDEAGDEGVDFSEVDEADRDEGVDFSEVDEVDRDEGVNFPEVDYEHAPKLRPTRLIAYGGGIVAMAVASIWLVTQATNRGSFSALARVPQGLARVPDETKRLLARATEAVTPAPSAAKPRAPATPAPRAEPPQLPPAPAAIPAEPDATSAAPTVTPAPAGVTPTVLPVTPTAPPATTAAPPVTRRAATRVTPPPLRGTAVPPPARPEAPLSAEPRSAGAAPAPSTSWRSPLIEADSAIRDVLGRYRTAFNVLDARAASDVWPTLDQRTLNRAFDQLAEQNVSFDQCAIDVRGVLAEARCTGTKRFVPKIGNQSAQVEPRRWNFTLRKSYTGWVIYEVEERRQ